MLPIVSIVGAKKSGKTTVVEALVKELAGRGLRVATMKHCHAGFQIDRAGSDSWRHLQAGAVEAALRGPEEFAVLGKGKERSFLRLAIFLLEEADLVLAEGFSEEKLPKIEVVRSAAGESPLHPPETLLAIVTDLRKEWPAPAFGFAETEGLANLIVERFLTTKKEVSLVIEGKQVGLNRFTDGFIASTVRGMLSALHDIPADAARISLHLRRHR